MEDEEYRGPERREHCGDHPDMQKHMENIATSMSTMNGALAVVKWAAGIGLPVIGIMCAWILSTLYLNNGDFRELKAQVASLEKRIDDIEGRRSAGK